jgi:DNA polymerase (family 10)
MASETPLRSADLDSQHRAVGEIAGQEELGTQSDCEETLRAERHFERGADIEATGVDAIDGDRFTTVTADAAGKTAEARDVSHDHGGQEPGELMTRYLRTMRHPLVNIITHPANRTPALSPGYDLDFETLFAAAVETGTAMEVDGAPGHLDMDGTLARRAAAAGVTIVIDSDCHRADGLARQMRFGVGTARRGWIEPRHVLNTNSVEKIRAFVAAKRARA